MTQRLSSSRTITACALLSVAFTISAAAQSTRWKEYVSEKGKFSVLLPGDPTTDYMGLHSLCAYQRGRRVRSAAGGAQK